MYKRQHTGLLELKNVLRPARVAEEDLRAGRFVLRNMLDFTNLREFLSITYTVRQNGQDVYEGSLSEEALDLAPHARKEFQIAYPKDLQGDFAAVSYTHLSSAACSSASA